MSQGPITTEQLAALLAGDLDPSHAAELRQAIEHDADAITRLAHLEQLAGFLAAERDARPPDAAVRRAFKAFEVARPGLVQLVREGVRKIIAALEFDSRMPSAALGLRGSAQAAQLSFSCEDTTIDLEISAQGPESWRVRGQIDTENENTAHIELVTTEEETVITSLDADPEGDFILDAPAGSFALRIAIGSTVIEAGPIVIP